MASAPASARQGSRSQGAWNWQDTAAGIGSRSLHTVHQGRERLAAREATADLLLPRMRTLIKTRRRRCDRVERPEPHDALLSQKQKTKREGASAD